MSDCFDHEFDAMTDLGIDGGFDEPGGRRFAPRFAPPRCKFCGSTDVRWRQQGGRWVLFSLQPGVVHTCERADPFLVVGD